MAEVIKLLVFETQSLPRGYEALSRISELGLISLEFSPHSRGVRIIYRIPVGKQEAAFQNALMSFLDQDESCEIVEINEPIMKAMLSQSGTGLSKYLLIVEVAQFAQLLKIAMQLHQVGAQPVEIRSLRSNSQKNYGIFTLENDLAAQKIVKNFDYKVIPASSSAVQDFLGFSS